MKFSHQQQEVLEAEGDLVVNAVAGSGKTTTLAGYALRRRQQKILYLAFNNSVKQEAISKFRKLGLDHVTVETAHSLALKNGPIRRPKIAPSNYQPYDLKQVLRFQVKDAVTDMKFGKHVLQLAVAFCNSHVKRVSDVEYFKLLSNPEEIGFVTEYYEQIEWNARKWLGMMKNGEIDMIHDFYLKMYQLGDPDLSRYDCILFDEAQDASPVMLDVFKQQSATKVMVGDEHQQIYSWRYAVNAMQVSDFQKKYLSTSYRFNQEVAELARSVLSTKNHIEYTVVPDIKGQGQATAEKVNATLGRTNGAILVDVIEKLVDTETIKSVYFEGHFQSYTYADEGGSVYDVLNLYLGNYGAIRNPMVKQFNDFLELQEYTDESGDAPMKGIIDIVMKYGRELPRLINCIKESHVDHQDKEGADMIYSTVHKAKGMEYDCVRLLDDFLGEDKLTELLKNPDFEANPNRLLEDINILYVALTRTKTKVDLPIQLVPEDYNYANKERVEVRFSDPISLMDEELPENPDWYQEVANATSSPSMGARSQARNGQPAAYSGWTLEEDTRLEDLFVQRLNMKAIAHQLGRSRGAISSRIKKLGLREKYFES